MRSINDAIDGLKAGASEAEKERAERAAEIRGRIEAGETTGDAILDFLAWMWPSGHDEALPHYRALDALLSGKKGQFVLMIERGQESVGGCMPSFGPPVRETFSLGVLMDDKLRLERIERGKLSFPTKRHAVRGARPFYGDGARDGDLSPRHFDTIFWRKTETPMEIRYPDGGGCFGGGGVSVDFCLGAERGKHISELEFVIGDAEIDAWCRRGAMHFPKDAPNEARCELIRELAGHLGVVATRISAVAQSIALSATNLLAEIEKRVADLRGAMTDLHDQNVRPHADIVKAIRDARGDIRALLERAKGIGLDTPYIQRLRAAHCDPAK